MKKIGAILKKHRLQNSLTIEEIANSCQIETKMYVHIESNKVYPDEALLEKLYEELSIDEQEIKRQKDINEEKAKTIMGYTLTLFSGLFLLSFFMKFEYFPYPIDFPRYNVTGFDFIFRVNFDEYISIKIAFALFVMQFGYYIYRFITKKLSSNVFNIMTILFSVTGVFFVYVGLYEEDTNIVPFVLLIILAILTTLVCIVGLILYPLKHDYLSEKIVVRKFIGFGFSVVLGLLFVTVIGYLVDDYSDLALSEYFVFTAWGIFVVVTFFLKNKFYENRLHVTLYLSLPSIIFFVFYVAYTLERNDDWEIEVLYYSLVMMLPVLAVNIDFIIENLKSTVLQLLDPKE